MLHFGIWPVWDVGKCGEGLQSVSVAAPSVRRRRLASQLRQLREHAGLTLEQVASRTDIATSTLSRIETARIGAKPVNVRALLAMYGVDGPDAEALVQLARDARQRGWWQSFADVVSSRYADYIGLESEAKVVRNYEPTIIPGLLQTKEYYLERALQELGDWTADDRQRRAEVRITRQRRLVAEPSLIFHAIIEESTLRRPVGTSELMQRQLQHLVDRASLPNVTLQVISEGVGVHPGLVGPFSILEFEDRVHQPDVGYAEFIGGQIFLDQTDDVHRCSALFSHLSNLALSEDESVGLISRLASTTL